MPMKEVVMQWDEKVFDGENRILPDALELYTQLYPPDSGAWSLVFSFELSPREQGYSTLGTVKFLVDEAPHKMLIEGFEFDFMDGRNKVGFCEILQ